MHELTFAHFGRSVLPSSPLFQRAVDDLRDRALAPRRTVSIASYPSLEALAAERETWLYANRDQRPYAWRDPNRSSYPEPNVPLRHVELYRKRVDVVAGRFTGATAMAQPIHDLVLAGQGYTPNLSSMPSAAAPVGHMASACAARLTGVKFSTPAANRIAFNRAGPKD